MGTFKTFSLPRNLEAMGLEELSNNWADDGESALDELPEKYVGPVDKDGFKTVIEYMINPRTSARMKVTKKVKVTKKMETIKKAVLDRRNWAKFGEPLNDWEKDGETRTKKLQKAFPDWLQKYSGIGFWQEGITYHPEKQTLDFTTKKKMTFKKKEVVAEVKAVGVWKRRETTSAAPAAGAAGQNVGPAAGGPKVGGAYVPPSMRAADGSRRLDTDNIRPLRDDSTTLRVSNLSDDTSEDDLQNLFRPFGNLTRVYIAKDRNTGLSRGFAFVNFIRKDDAARAMEALAGYGYDHLILQIEWAQPSNN